MKHKDYIKAMKDKKQDKLSSFFDISPYEINVKHNVYICPFCNNGYDEVLEIRCINPDCEYN